MSFARKGRHAVGASLSIRHEQPIVSRFDEAKRFCVTNICAAHENGHSVCGAAGRARRKVAGRGLASRQRRLLASFSRLLRDRADGRIAGFSLSAEIRFTRPLVPGVGRSGYADMGCAQGGRPALAQICEIGFSRLDPVDQFRVAGIATQHQEIDRQTD